MFDKKGTKIRYKAALSALILTLSGCSVPVGSVSEPVQETKEDTLIKKPNIYDSEDAAVVVKKNAEEGTVQFQNIATAKRYTLNYDGTTEVFDKNDVALSMQQLKEGSVVTVRFYKADKSLSYVKENAEALNLPNLSNYELDLRDGKITVGSQTYLLSSNVVVISEGRETEPWELNALDVISVWGYQDRIYGINVEKGHGYLRLQNEDYFVDGWVDVGDKVIQKIEEDMLLVVPEGTFNAMVSHKGSSAMQEISFARNEEMVWDLGSVEITVVQTGKIIFTLTPATARMAIDGREVDTSKPVELTYGLHSMRIVAEGYDTVAQYIKVAEPSANISVELEKSSEPESKEPESGQDKKTQEDKQEETPVSKKYALNATNDGDDGNDDDEEEEEKESEERSSAASSDVLSASEKYKVYIDAPEDVEAYLNGSYIGMTPVSFPKNAGSYVVTLRKNGYQTRSYTLQIDSEKKDVNYSFTELLESDE